MGFNVFSFWLLHVFYTWLALTPHRRPGSDKVQDSLTAAAVHGGGRGSQIQHRQTAKQMGLMLAHMWTYNPTYSHCGFRHTKQLDMCMHYISFSVNMQLKGVVQMSEITTWPCSISVKWVCLCLMKIPISYCKTAYSSRGLIHYIFIIHYIFTFIHTQTHTPLHYAPVYKIN